MATTDYLKDPAAVIAARMKSGYDPFKNGNILTVAAENPDLPPGVGGTYYGGPLAVPKPTPIPGTRGAELDSPPGVGGTYFNGPLANPPAPSPTPGVRPTGGAAPFAAGLPARGLAPRFDAKEIVAQQQANAQASAAPEEIPWWKRSSFTPEFQNYINQSQKDIARAGQEHAPGPGGYPSGASGWVRLNRNTYIPQSVNYNNSSSV